MKLDFSSYVTNLYLSIRERMDVSPKGRPSDNAGKSLKRTKTSYLSRNQSLIGRLGKINQVDSRSLKIFPPKITRKNNSNLHYIIFNSFQQSNRHRYHGCFLYHEWCYLFFILFSSTSATEYSRN